MDQIFITDLVARGIIGINDWERKVPQGALVKENRCMWRNRELCDFPDPWGLRLNGQKKIASQEIADE
jgi:hypothetical protein